MPDYDKPMIYYSLSILLLAGIREIVLISSAQALPQFKGLFGDGLNLGIKIDYVEQNAPNGNAEALILAEPYVDGHETELILGDNIFLRKQALRGAFSCFEPLGWSDHIQLSDQRPKRIRDC